MKSQAEANYMQGAECETEGWSETQQGMSLLKPGREGGRETGQAREQTGGHVEKHGLHSPAWILGQANQEVLGHAEGRYTESPVRDGGLLSPSHSALPSEPPMEL